jgi:hypothetical protein
MIAASSSNNRRKVVDAHRHSLRELTSISNSAPRVAIPYTVSLFDVSATLKNMSIR